MINSSEWAPGMTLEYIEKQVILKAFRHFGGVQSVTAQALGISAKTLYNKLQQYGVKVSNGATSNEQPAPKHDGHGRLSGAHALDNPDRIGAPSLEGKETGERKDEGQAPSLLSAERDGMEPDSKLPAQQLVPLQQRQEVQTVLPKQNAGSSARRR